MKAKNILVKALSGSSQEALMNLILEKKEESIVSDFLNRVNTKAEKILETLEYQIKVKEEGERKLKEVEELLAKASISNELQARILNNPSIFNYISHILTTNERVLKARKEAGLSTIEKVVNHLLLRNPKGVGCGCELCKIRYKEHMHSLHLNSYRNEVNRMDDIEEGLLGVKDGKGEYPLRRDPFASEFFNNHNTVFIKTAEDIAARKVSRLKDLAGVGTLSNRVERSKSHLHKCIELHFGKYNKYHNARVKLPNLVYLPL